MLPKLQHRYEFTSREKWAHYATTNMRAIEAELHEKSTEIWLVAKRGVIGKWCNETNLGYIEEYRDNKRLAKDNEDDQIIE